MDFWKTLGSEKSYTKNNRTLQENSLVWPLKVHVTLLPEHEKTKVIITTSYLKPL